MTTAANNARAASSAGPGVTMARVLRSERIKLQTLRSSWYTMLAAVVSMLAIGLLVAYLTSTSSHWATLDLEDRVVSAPLQGYKLATLFIGVLGVLFVSGEYGTGMIRSTFASVPRRLPVLAAKSTVYGLVALVTMTAASFATFFSAQIILSAHHHGSSLSDPGALRSVAGVGVVLALIALLGGALGWMVRSTAGAISGLVGLLMVVPAITGLLPGKVSSTVGKILPSEAGDAFVQGAHKPDTLSPWLGLAVLVAWVAFSLVVAGVTIRRRDA